MNHVLSVLRQTTRDLHRQTEQALDLPRVLATREEYTRLLARLLGFYEPLETQLMAGRWMLRFPQDDALLRRKIPALRRDLDALGWRDVVECCTYVPKLTSEAAEAGAWYVVEGATLGGQVIARQLAKRLGIEREHGARFFDSYADERGRRWTEFCQLLEAMPANDSDAAASGAVAVFEAMKLWLETRPGATGQIGASLLEASG